MASERGSWLVLAKEEGKCGRWLKQRGRTMTGWKRKKAGGHKGWPKKGAGCWTSWPEVRTLDLA